MNATASVYRYTGDGGDGTKRGERQIISLDLSRSVGRSAVDGGSNLSHLSDKRKIGRRANPHIICDYITLR